MNTTDICQANIIESMLRAHDIPVLRKHKGFDGYMKIVAGRTLLGVDIYVPQNALEAALEIVKCDPLESNEDEENLQNKKLFAFLFEPNQSNIKRIHLARSVRAYRGNQFRINKPVLS